MWDLHSYLRKWCIWHYLCRSSSLRQWHSRDAHYHALCWRPKCVLSPAVILYPSPIRHCRNSPALKEQIDYWPVGLHATLRDQWGLTALFCAVWSVWCCVSCATNTDMFVEEHWFRQLRCNGSTRAQWIIYKKWFWSLPIAQRHVLTVLKCTLRLYYPFVYLNTLWYISCKDITVYMTFLFCLDHCLEMLLPFFCLLIYLWMSTTPGEINIMWNVSQSLKLFQWQSVCSFMFNSCSACNSLH